MQHLAETEVIYPAGASGVEHATDVGLGNIAEAWKQRLINAVLISCDLALAVLIWTAAGLVQGVLGRGPLSGAMLALVAASMLVWIVMRALLGLYPGYGMSQVEELRRQVYALLGTGATATTFAIAMQLGPDVSRLLLFSGFLGLLLVVPVARPFIKQRMRNAGLWGKPVLIMGSGGSGELLAEILKQEWNLGFRPMAVFSSRPTSPRERFVCLPDESSRDSAVAISRKHGMDTMMLAMPHIRREKVAELVSWAGLEFRQVTVIPNLDGVTNSAVVARDIGGIFGVEIRYNLLDPSVRRLKRALDLVSTLVGGILILPLIAVISLLILLESGGPVFYRAKRMGRDGKLFSCVKFRTMALDAEAALERLLEEDPRARDEYATYHKLRYDPRVTRVGRLLRKASLDELPQLWNVIRGDMSLVGPRPYLPRESDDIGDTQSEILRVHPGITGPWQVDGRNHTSFAERVGMDAYYVRNWSIWLDLVILVRTVKAVLPDRGAY